MAAPRPARATKSPPGTRKRAPAEKRAPAAKKRAATATKRTSATKKRAPATKKRAATATKRAPVTKRRAAAKKASTPGRSPAPQRARRPRPVLGVDLGGTKVQAVRVEGGEVVADARSDTPTGGPADIVATIAALLAEVGTRGATAVGVGAPGVIDAATGVIRRAPNLPGFDDPVPFGDLVTEATGVRRVVLDNDVNVAALAEHRIGAGQGSSDMLAVFMGTGVGGGLVLGGELRSGPAGMAGELGHVMVEDGGRRCSCGQRGHLEGYAGRGMLERRARKLAAKGRKSKLLKLAGEDRMRSSIWAKALDQGDDVAIELIDEAAQALGAALASAVALVDVERIVIGGGLGDRLGAPFVARVEQEARSRMLVPDAAVAFVPAVLGDLTGARGAAILASERLSTRR